MFHIFVYSQLLVFQLDVYHEHIVVRALECVHNAVQVLECVHNAARALEFDIFVVEEVDMVVDMEVGTAVGMEVENSVYSIAVEHNILIEVIFYNSTSFLVLNIFYKIEMNRNPF